MSSSLGEKKDVECRKKEKNNVLNTNDVKINKFSMKKKKQQRTE